ncbi:MAG: TonB-dependent receptor [Planctomycetota bacterium]
MSLGATYFHNSFDQLIKYDFATKHFENINSALTSGVEAFFTIKPVKEIELQSTATFLHTEDATGQPLRRRPAETYTGRLILRPLLRLVPEKHAGLEIALSAIHVSDRTDIGPTSTKAYATVINPAYTRLDLAVSYRFLEHFRAFARVDNFTNEKYESAKTFPSEGASFLGGLEFSWKF